MDDDEVVRPGELDRLLEVARLDDRAGRVVRVVEEEQVRPRADVGRDRVEIGQEAALGSERQVVDLGSREDGPGGVGRIAGIG